MSAPGSKPSPLPAIALALLFFALSALTLPNISRWRGDEGYYTNAALKMLQTGDWLTPFWPSGEPRFNKPPLNYWLILASYHLLGVSVFSARVAQLLAGALALLATHRLARVLFDRPSPSDAPPDSAPPRATLTVGLLTVCFMLASEQLLNVSVRATTDVVQFAAMTAALAGFAGIIFRNPHPLDARPTHPVVDYALAFGGISLAVLTKGAMALLLFAYVVGFAITFRRSLPPGTIRRVASWHGIVLILAPTTLWLALNISRYGPSVLTGLSDDQVGSRLDGSIISYLLKNSATYLTAPLLELLPATLVAAPAIWVGRAESRKLLLSRRRETLFCLAWFATALLALVWGNITRTRYLLPTYPALAAVLAFLALGLAARSDPARRALLGMTRIVLVGLTVFGALLLALGLRIMTSPNAVAGDGGLALPPPLAGALILAAALTALFLTRTPKATDHTTTSRPARSPLLGLILVQLLALSAYRLTDLSIRPYLFTIAVDEVIPAIRAAGLQNTRIATISLSEESDQLRLLSQGTAQVSQFRTTTVRLEDLIPFDAILLAQNSPLNLGPDLDSRFKVVPIAPKVERWRPTDLWHLLIGSQSLEQIRQARGDHYRLLVKKSPQGNPFGN